MNIKLYYTPRTRATRVRWLLEELEQDYEIVPVDLFNGEGDNEAYKKIHPLGCVPAIDIDGTIMFESTAICQWLSDQHPQKLLAPPGDSPARMKYIQWLYFVSATLEPQAWNIVLHSLLLPEQDRIPAIVPWSKEKFKQAMAVIDDQLKDRDYLLGVQFTTADIVLTNLLSWLPKQVKDHSHAYAYMKRVMARDKYRLVCA